MSFGFQTFIKGTSFDAINSIDFNYVLDAFDVSAGSGSRSYTARPGLTLKGIIQVQYFPGTTSSYSITTSGDTVSWTVPGRARIAVIGTYS